MTIDQLKPFCSRDETRKTIMNPFSYGEFTYATDRRILVRVARLADVPEVPHAPRKEFIEKIISDATSTDWMDVPELPKPDSKRCPDCNGVGNYEQGDKPEIIQCDTCDGTGQDRRLIPVDIRCQQFADIFLEKIKALPGAMIAPSITDELKPMPFKFKEGVGVLMPMRKTYEPN